MILKPSLEEFQRLATKGNLIPVSLDIIADEITPVSLLTSHWDSSPNCFLLESVEGGEKLGRYSIVSFNPDSVVQETGGVTTHLSPGGKVLATSNLPAVDFLKNLMTPIKAVEVPGIPRFFGGAVGYCSYEMIHSIEKIPREKPDVLGWPTSTFYLTGDLFIFDNTQQVLKIVTCAKVARPSEAAAAYRKAQEKIRGSLRLLKKTKAQKKLKPKIASLSDGGYSTNSNRAAYMAAVEKAKEYIGCGDIIQVVLSRRNEKKTTASPLDIYRALRFVNPSPYMYILKMQDRAVIGSSPESLVRLERGVATTRPIAGTRPRGKNEQEDMRLADELLKDPKERAEHVMLVDLGRNDIGRVCEYGTVKVPTFMKIERYSHVMHIVSEVTGKIKSGSNAFDLLKAVFPAGTVSGAPKIRAMEIINELEDSERGLYAGALGYISYSGNMDMAITIRTILWNRGQVVIQSGGGLVADSDPSTEYDETENKAAGLKETIRWAENRQLFWDSL